MNMVYSAALAANMYPEKHLCFEETDIVFGKRNYCKRSLKEI